MKIQANHSGTRSIEISEKHLQTIEKYSLLDNLVDSNGIIDEPVLDKLKFNVRSMLESETVKDNDLLDLCLDVIYNNNMKAFGLQQLVDAYKQWNNSDMTQKYQLTDFLPTTRKECELRGWDELDVILFSGDAYVDHPSFGAAVIGRLLEAKGYKVAIVPQPDWHGDYRDFKKLGRPRLFFAVSAGAMDSMVNRYTANRRMRHDDAYSPDARHDMRPDYPSIVYTKILKQLFPDVPVVLGGIEASMRRLTHYDYWQDRLMKCILCDSGADMILYGMGEKNTIQLCREIEEGRNIKDIRDIPQTVYLCKQEDIPGGISDDDIVLHSHEECLQSKKAEAENFRHIEEESNKMHAQRLLQAVDGKFAVVNPPYPPLTTEEVDEAYDLPYTRLPHPKYKGKTIPAYEMIKFSINLHRGCFGGCAFCTISAHQGKFIACRSKESILREARQVIAMDGHVWHGRTQQESVRALQATVVHQSTDLSQPQHGSLPSARHLPCCRCVAGCEKEFHRQWCALRSSAL